MTDQEFQLVAMLIQAAVLIVTTVTSTLYSFKALTRSFDEKLEIAMRGKVDLWVYSAKVKELHDQLNQQGKDMAALQAELRVTREIVQGVIDA